MSAASGVVAGGSGLRFLVMRAITAPSRLCLRRDFLACPESCVFRDFAENRHSAAPVLAILRPAHPPTSPRFGADLTPTSHLPSPPSRLLPPPSFRRR